MDCFAALAMTRQRRPWYPLEFVSQSEAQSGT